VDAGGDACDKLRGHMPKANHMFRELAISLNADTGLSSLEGLKALARFGAELITQVEHVLDR
jgi:hypothetical protein